MACQPTHQGRPSPQSSVPSCVVLKSFQTRKMPGALELMSWVPATLDGLPRVLECPGCRGPAQASNPGQIDGVLTSLTTPDLQR